MPNAADTPAGKGTFGSKRKQPKRHHLNAIIAREISMPRIPVGTDDGSKNATLPSTRKRKDGTYIDSQTKQKAVITFVTSGGLDRNNMLHISLAISPMVEKVIHIFSALGIPLPTGIPVRLVIGCPPSI
ncbi:hypothetical protein CTI12_AA564380 [Artemisia annua]|uniref:Uncharacterized protein n=1 Tax=Artemisia annua TaxID=35608 RepID=A0A2U1KTN4_ARTAN|nr:hypothetical protein CTI12_AA564380 [Artemisia annua]